MKNNKKQILYAFIIVLVVSLCSIVIVSFFNKGNDEKIDLKFSGKNNFRITNKLPISDKLGKSISENNDIKSYLEFSVENKSDKDGNFEIYVTKKDTTHNISDNYVKFYLTDDSDVALEGFNKNKIPSYKEFNVLNNKPSSKLIYSGSISKNTKENFKLRVWISDSYALTDNLEEFSATIGVRVK